MIRVNIKPERENYQEPIKGSEDAACLDVYASKIEKKDGMVICYLGFSTEIPQGFKGVVIPRSNLTKYGWCIPNSPGQIDSDFRNEWQVRFRPLSCHAREFPYKEGERVAQIYFEEVSEVVLLPVEATSETKRGKEGFGSSGLK